MEAPLPSWLAQDEAYRPRGDRDAYLGKNLLSLLQLLSRAQVQRGREGRFSPSADAKLLLTLTAVVLTALARSGMFLWLMGALALVRLCLLPARQLWHTLRPVLGAAVFTAAVLLPAAIFGRWLSCARMLARVLISMAWVSLFSHTTNWNFITGSLRRLHVPDLFIFTLDMALHYIVLLGRSAAQLLEALTLRSIGKNTEKYTAVSGVLGGVYVRAQTLSRETVEAMLCRGWSGDYMPACGSGRYRGAVYAAIAGLVALFIYLEGFV
ncbi:MAG: energy-coupling factor transporter transmembrane component T [Oscillospiraceae bacterium]|nr:energy-coupling factor transporter transmembrane component T [Oscillospiraceae bacterium]